MRISHDDPGLATMWGYGLTLALLAACCAAYWLVDPLFEGGLWMAPAAVTTVLAARWLNAGAAAVGLLAGTFAGELLFAQPRGDWAAMLARDADSIAVTLAIGALVIWTVTELRSRASRLDHEVALRQRAELDRDTTRRQFEQFLDIAPFAAYLKDADGRFLFTNRHLRAIYPEVVAGRTVHDMFTAEQADAFTRNDDWVRQTGEHTHCEEVAVGTDGVERYWSTFKFPVTDDRGRRGVGGVSFEITDRKRADDQVIQSESLLRRLIEVQEHEKQALCHEFHDGLMQYAIAARMMLEAWRHGHPDADAAVVDDVIRSLGAGIVDGRRAIRGIRPATLDDRGLKAAVEEYAASLARPELDVAVAVADEVNAIPPAVQTTAFRIVQEACSNAVRHSGTDRIRVDVRMDGETLEIRVEDSGCGFDTASPPHTGFGIAGMAQRARIGGGSCRVESVPGRGTVITARLAATEA